MSAQRTCWISEPELSSQPPFRAVTKTFSSSSGISPTQATHKGAQPSPLNYSYRWPPVFYFVSMGWVNETFAGQQKAVQVLIRTCYFQHRIQLEGTQSFKAIEKSKKVINSKSLSCCIVKAALNCIPKMIKEGDFDLQILKLAQVTAFVLARSVRK